MTTIAELERKLTGHKGWVRSVTVSPDGQWAVSDAGSITGNKDNTVRIWDLATGKCRATLKGHTDIVRSIAITTDTQRILSGSHDDTVRIWAVRQRKQVAKLELAGMAPSICPLPDNKRVLVGISSPENTVELWSFDHVRRIWGRRTESPTWCVAVDREARRAVSGHHDGNLHLWNPETGEGLATLKGHAGIVLSVQITPDGRFAVSGSEDKTVKIWDLEARRCVGTLEGHQGNVLSVALSPDGNLIASTGFMDHTVRLWRRESGTCLHVIENEDKASPIAVAFTPDGARLVVGTSEGPIYVYHLNLDATSSPDAVT